MYEYDIVGRVHREKPQVKSDRITGISLEAYSVISPKINV